MGKTLCCQFLDLVEGPNGEIDAARRMVEAFSSRDLGGVVALCTEAPLLFCLSFLRILECGGTPVLMPSPEEINELNIAWTLDESGLRRSAQNLECGLTAIIDTYYAFSSGSTGQRKPLRFSRDRALSNARAHARSLGLGPEHTIIQTLRLHHTFGMVAYIFAPLACGARIRLGVFFDSLFSSKQSSDLSDCVVHLTPYHVQHLQRRNTQARHRVGRLSVGSAPLRRVEAEFAAHLCHELFVTYGLSEAGPRVSTGQVDLESYVDGWIGYPIEGVQGKIDADGVLWLKTAHACSDIVTSEYFNTGDCVEALKDGSWVFKSRLHDVLRIRGQTCSRTQYSQRVSELVGLSCEVGQREYSDGLLIFIESAQSDPSLLRKIHHGFPELKDARIIWQDEFERSVLGKVNLRSMMARAK